MFSLLRTLVHKLSGHVACPRCDGKGTIARFRARDGGRCYRCNGTGWLRKEQLYAIETASVEKRPGYKYYTDGQVVGTYRQLHDAGIPDVQLRLATIDELRSYVACNTDPQDEMATDMAARLGRYDARQGRSDADLTSQLLAILQSIPQAPAQEDADSPNSLFLE